MKGFKDFKFDPRICRQELNELKFHLDSKFELSERKDVLPFFKQREHLSSFIGSYFPYISSFDKLAYEYDIFGDFKADLAIGDSESGWYGFIEFEGASETSIFDRKGGKITPEWSSRFEHGFSQVVDWFWKLLALENTREFISQFGSEFTGYEGMLIIGRSEGLEQRERDRLRWRRDRLIVNSKHIHCVTFDELYYHLDTRLRSYEAAFLADEE
jgi:Domain of unknown function (DUF4263)